MTPNSTREIAWRPTPQIAAASHLRRFMDRHGIASLDELQRRSTADIAWFWDAMLKDLDIRFYKPYSQVVDLSHGVECPRWCVGGEMNIVHNLLDRYAGTATDERIAIKFESEDGQTRLLSYRDLRHEVNRVANALREIGIGRGDAVGVFMPMTVEIVVLTKARMRTSWAPESTRLRTSRPSTSVPSRY